MVCRNTRLVNQQFTDDTSCVLSYPFSVNNHLCCVRRVYDVIVR